MNHEPEDDLDDTHTAVDVLLRERLGNERPRDLTAVIAARRLQGDGKAAARACTAAARPRQVRQRWLAAAIMVLATGAVLATQWALREEAAKRALAAQQQAKQDPVPQPAAGTVQLRVVDDHGAPVQSFTLSILRVFDTKPVAYGKVLEVPDRDVRPADFSGDSLTVRDLPAGNFVALVTADGWARTTSAPFAVVAEQAGPAITVALTLGGELAGVVLDPKGKPLAGALVTTRSSAVLTMTMNSLFAKLLELRPERLTVASARTDETGRFRLRRLAFGSYGLVVEHPDYCAAEVRDLPVEAATKSADVDVRMMAGAIVRGTARSAGDPLAQVEVTLVSVEAAEQAQEHQTLVSSWTATTDATGAFRFAMRLPPAKYRLTTLGKRTANDNPLLLAQRSNQSAVEFTIEPGQDAVTQDLELPR